MSRFRAFLRVIGDQGVVEEFGRLRGDMTADIARQVASGGSAVQPNDVLLLELARWQRPGIFDGDDRAALLADEMAQLSAASATLRRMAPMLATLNRSRCTAELYISTIRDEDQGGLEIPAELVAAAAAGALSIDISILVAVGREDVTDDNDAPMISDT